MYYRDKDRERKRIATAKGDEMTTGTKAMIKKIIHDYFIPTMLVFGIALAGTMLVFDAILARMAGYY